MKLIVCAPGRTYSGEFLDHWTTFLGQILLDGRFEITLSRKYSPNIYHARNLCLGGDIRKGRAQKPFGEAKYDYILWIDSDILFNFDNFLQLFNRDENICSGIYRMQNGEFATVKHWDTSRLEEKGGLDFCTEADFTNKTDLIEVAYTGMGFMLIKAGVLEKLSYPWFRPLNIDIGKIYDFSTEDVSFCQSVQQQGFKVYVDPLVRVGHEKKFII